jgi:hypothetical protein
VAELSNPERRRGGGVDIADPKAPRQPENTQWSGSVITFLGSS